MFEDILNTNNDEEEENLSLQPFFDDIKLLLNAYIFEIIDEISRADIQADIENYLVAKKINFVLDVRITNKHIHIIIVFVDQGIIKEFVI